MRAYVELKNTEVEAKLKRDKVRDMRLRRGKGTSYLDKVNQDKVFDDSDVLIPRYLESVPHYNELLILERSIDWGSMRHGDCMQLLCEHFEDMLKQLFCRQFKKLSNNNTIAL